MDRQDRDLLLKMQPEQMFILLDELTSAAHAVLADLKETPGGDAYEYQGSMNDVEWLREASHAWDDYKFSL